MEYISTRGRAPSLGFSDIIFSGLAQDGGLYVPLYYPSFSKGEMARMEGAPYQSVAHAVFSRFCGDTFSDQELEGILDRAYGAFRHGAVAPLRQLSSHHWLLELFHGPTFAFKDVALRLLAQMVDAALGRQERKVTIVVATSGDTGSAALSAFRHARNVQVCVLHPKGRVSDIQRLQMTTVLEPHVHNLAIEGDFDDCQRIVKSLFSDHAFAQSIGLMGVNSLNWVRILAQVVYYIFTTLSLGGREVDITVPTGNFGNIFAGYVAKKLGAPIRRLIVATNVNDLLYRALTTGRYESRQTMPSSSPSMDIQVSSNFERLIFEACGRNSAVLGEIMAEFSNSSGVTLPPSILGNILENFSAGRCGEEETLATIGEVFDATGEILDPHTAVGYAVGERFSSVSVPMVTLATAHPAKFSNTVEKALGSAGKVVIPEALSSLSDRAERFITLPPDVRAVADFLKASV